MDAVGFVIRAEKRLLSIQSRTSKPYLNSILADGFVEIGQSGTLYDKAALIAKLVSTPHIKVHILDITAKYLSRKFILVKYTTLNPKRNKYPIARHSLWQMRDSNINQKFGAKWQLLYHEAEANYG